MKKVSILQRVLKALAGGNETIISQQLVFNKVIGVKGLSSGVGTSTVVQSLAYYYSITKKMRVCVVDTSFLTPIQESLLGAEPNTVDMLQYTGDISAVTSKTKFKGVYLVSLRGRGIVDMIDKDNSKIYLEVLKKLKTYFDVILVDLCNEHTDINTTAAIKCNRIITVADQSNKCIYHVRNTLNTNATLAIAREKQKITILNKVVEGVKTSTVQSLEQSGLRVVAQIPYSREVAWKGITADPCYTPTTESKTNEIFNKAIELIAESFIEKNPNNEELHGESTYTGTTLVSETAEIKGKKAEKLQDKQKKENKGKSFFGKKGKEMPTPREREVEEVESYATGIEEVTTYQEKPADDFVNPYESQRQKEKPNKQPLFAGEEEEEEEKPFSIFD